MIQLHIDNQTVQVAPGTTVLDAAAQVGVTIPTLCHSQGLPHYTSCMLCVVRETASGQFIPACSAPVSEGMLIDTQSEAVRAARRAALELLLSDHTGDCDGPCQRACPSHLDIPGLIRTISGAENAAAPAPDACRACRMQHPSPPPCERACRRAQLDQPVAIARLMDYLTSASSPMRSVAPPPTARPAFNSAMGRIRDEEWPILMEGVNGAAQTAPQGGETAIFDPQEAQVEATRCMHCDCRKPVTCKLRVYAAEYGARRMHFRTSERRPFEHDRSHPDIVFEQGKCISCGICIRVAAQHGGSPGLCFSGRGITMRLEAPLGHTLSEGLGAAAADCVAACPTGALAWKSTEKSDGGNPPFKTEQCP